MRVSMNDIGILIQPHQPINTIMYEWTDLYPYLPNNKKNKLTIEYSILIVSLLSASIVSMYYTIIHIFNCRPDRLTIKTV